MIAHETIYLSNENLKMNLNHRLTNLVIDMCYVLKLVKCVVNVLF